MQYLALQQSGCFTDIILQCKDGRVSLHQAVLLPLSKLLVSSAMPSFTDMPVVLILPDYDLSTVESLVYLLYTGSCLHQSSANYLSLLNLLGSLGINLSSCTLSVFSTPQNNETDGTRVSPHSTPSMKPTTYPPNHSHSSVKNRDMTPSVEGIETLLLRTNNTSNVAISEAETNHINQQINTGNDLSEQEPESESVANVLFGNSCPVCGVEVVGGIFVLRKHLMEKHLYKEVAALLGEGTKQCPVCEKTFEPRHNLVRHFGIVHRRVDQILGVDINQNYPVHCAINEEETEDDGDESFSSGIEQSSLGLFKCMICGCCRKSQFRLLQHYSIAHYREQLEDNFGLQYVKSNGTCNICRKIMKNLNSFLVHMGSSHGEVFHLLKGEDKKEALIMETLPLSYWLCPGENCNVKFTSKSLLMKHFTFQHYIKELTTALQPLFFDSKSCRECGKTLPDFQRFLLHYSVTHKMLLTYCSQSELDVLQGQESKTECNQRTEKIDREKIYRCKLCNFEVFNKYLLKKHYTARHYFNELSSKFSASVSSGVCEICGEQYSSVSGSRMIQHLGVAHKQVETLIKTATKGDAATELED